MTYRLASAPYLGICAFYQLEQNEGEKYSLAKHIILNNTYVDDILSGADDIDQSRAEINDLIQLLKARRFQLQKWASSHEEILKDIALSKRETTTDLNIDQSPFLRAVGLAWRSDIDSFTFTPQINEKYTYHSKRKVLSQIVQLLDPLGWLAPITIRAKIYMQKLWSFNLEWNMQLFKPLSSQWSEFLRQLQDVSTITIPRWIGLHSSALAAVSDSHEARVSLLCAKTKVAPLKKVIISRLELCVAHLLVKQVHHVEKT